MQYLLLIYSDEQQHASMDDVQSKAVLDRYLAFNKEAKGAGVFVGGDALQPTASATSVRVRNGERMVTDGPFAETKEQLGGYYLVDCDNLDDAIQWASKIPAAEHGTVEVRPVMVIPGDG